MSGIFSSGDDASSEFGMNSYQQKKQMIDESYNNNFNVDDMNEVNSLVTKLLREDIPNAAISAVNTISATLMPGFLDRLRKKKIHAKIVEDIERFESFVALGKSNR